MGIGALGGMAGGGFGAGGLGGAGGMAGAAAKAGAAGVSGRGPMPVNVINSGALGLAIGGAVAGAIYAGGVTEVTRMESESSYAVKQAKLGGEVGREYAKGKLAELEKTKESKKQWVNFAADVLSYHPGMMIGDTLSSVAGVDAGEQRRGVMQWASDLVDPTFRQRETDISSIQKAISQGEAADAQQSMMEWVETTNSLTTSTMDGIEAINVFSTKLREVEIPTLNRSNEQSPVK
jgi:hypothetical protein